MTISQHRVAAVAAALVGVFLFLTVAAVNVPHEATDAELLAWWQQSGNRWSGVFSGMFAIGVAASVAVVRHHLGSLRGDSAWMGFGRSMATAVTALWLVTGAVRAAVGHLVDVMDQPLPGVDVLRIVTALNYVLLGLSGMAALGLMMLGVSVALLPSWVGRLGIGGAVVVLGATLAQYGAYVTLVAIAWTLCLAGWLWRSQSVTSATVASSAAGDAASTVGGGADGVARSSLTA